MTTVPISLREDDRQPSRFGLLQALGLAALTAQLGVATFAPDPLLHLGEPPYLATASDLLVTLTLLGLRWASPRPLRLEQAILALFLAGMPLVYAWSAWLLKPGLQPMLALEGVGVLIYAGLAWLGFRGHPALLAFGIASHGLGWDLWHWDGTGAVPAWYAQGCCLADLCIGFYVMTERERYRLHTPRSR